MSDGYSIIVDLDDADTQAFLIGKSLRVYKGVQTGATGLPVVWFSQNDFGNGVTLAWQEQYAGFVADGGTPVDGVRIKDISSAPMDLGEELTAGNTGTVIVSRTGLAGAITVTSAGTRDWMGGMGQMLNGVLNPFCAFDVGGGGNSVIMEPYEKVLLVFESTAQVDTGTVVAEAISASLTVELDGDNPSRTVTYRKNTGWTGNIETWATQNEHHLDLARALIVPGSAAAQEDLRSRAAAHRRRSRPTR